MFKFTFIKAPRPRQYYHKNIYYDPEKEERQERDARINKELGITPPDGTYTPSIKRGSFRRNRMDDIPETRDIRSERRRANIRFLIIAIVLIALAAILYLTSSDFLAL